jgi:hypothetical protein
MFRALCEDAGFIVWMLSLGRERVGLRRIVSMNAAKIHIVEG